jgi:hypothetical protein
MNVVITTVFVKKPYKGCEIFRENGEQKWVYKSRDVLTYECIAKAAEKQQPVIPGRRGGILA